jgi:hypothetical protein
MDFESAILAAIALAFALHVQNHPISVPGDWLNQLAVRSMMCTEVEVGLPCREIPPGPGALALAAGD